MKKVTSALFSLAILLTLAVADAAPTCEAMQKSLYAKSTIKIRMVFGYKDARPARFVGDRHERLAFIDRVTTPCAEAKNSVCGFLRSRENADLFMKKMEIGGKEKKILLSIVNSSVGTDDQENQADPFQAWKSRYASQAFFSGLKDADIVFYNGHSRFGGGPDFASPELNAEGQVDPNFYKTEKSGLTKMLSSLEKSRGPKDGPFSKLKVLGLFSCASSQHFNEDLRKVTPAGLVSSHVLMYYADALNQSLDSLNSILENRCIRSLTFK